ncbi:MAG: hypothetical protein GY797_27935 [Deltaproteobacteria bacterium]|nr:hypothetical protein [Deltaproteobacteria bacterium]
MEKNKLRARAMDALLRMGHDASMLLKVGEGVESGVVKEDAVKMLEEAVAAKRETRA